MLTSLSIKNYALIEEAQFTLSKGFTVITGETGAGKSILLGALGLITGKRADISSLGDPDLKCVIEGEFDITGHSLRSFFDKHDLDFDTTTLVRREISASGKSRAFINDTPVNLKQLQELGKSLVDVHSQHKTMDVVDAAYQIEVIDAFAGTEQLLTSYREQYAQFQKCTQAVIALREKQQKAQLEFEYQSFLFNELDEAQLKAGEYEQLDQEVKVLSNAESITEDINLLLQKLSVEEFGVLSQLSEARLALSRVASKVASFQELSDRLHSVVIELEDITQEVEAQAEIVQANPERLVAVNERIQQLYNLMQKHKVATTEDLIATRERLDNELFEIKTGDSVMAKLEEELAFAKAESKRIALQLSKKRQQAVPKLQMAITNIVQSLGMPLARFEIAAGQNDALRADGIDTIEFLFSANAGRDVKPLGKAASGGELSRVMLAVKSVVSNRKKLPTLIFDEIDTGVSGEIALKMGEVLKSMGDSMQLLSITHLPQIAGQGAAHFRVYKTTSGGVTTTKVKPLSQDERIVEIASMLGGAQQSDAAMAHAKNLLN